MGFITVRRVDDSERDDEKCDGMSVLATVVAGLVFFILLAVGTENRHGAVPEISGRREWNCRDAGGRNCEYPVEPLGDGSWPAANYTINYLDDEQVRRLVLSVDLEVPAEFAKMQSMLEQELGTTPRSNLLQWLCEKGLYRCEGVERAPYWKRRTQHYRQMLEEGMFDLYYKIYIMYGDAFFMEEVVAMERASATVQQIGGRKSS